MITWIYGCTTIFFASCSSIGIVVVVKYSSIFWEYCVAIFIVNSYHHILPYRFTVDAFAYVRQKLVILNMGVS